MKNVRLKISIAMIFTTVIVLLVSLFLLNKYQEKYILEKVNDELLLEASYFNNSGTLSTFELDENRLYDIKYLMLGEEEFGDDFFVDSLLNHEALFFNSKYNEGEIIENKIVELEDDHASYHAIAVRITDKQLMEYFSLHKEELPESRLLLLYIDITAYKNILLKLENAFSIVFVIVVLLEVIIGFKFGKRIEDSQRKLGHFFQNASHELKTPLTSIQGYAEGIKSGMVGDTEMAADVIKSQSENMLRLISELLTISKLDSDDYELKKEDVDMLSIIEESVEKYQDLPSKSHIDVALSLDEKNSVVIGDSLQLYKAINTVIDNAFKYAKSRVHICTYARDKYLTIDIYNDGSSISDEDVKHIFDRFYSGDKISTGIGLAMSREIVRLSGGKILVENKDEGVVFSVKLPRS